MFPSLYAAFVVVELTDDTVGPVVSIINALFAPREFVAPGVASVNVAAFPDASLMVPLFKASALVLV